MVNKAIQKAIKKVAGGRKKAHRKGQRRKGDYSFKGEVKTRKGGTCGYRSLYEKKVMRLLDSNTRVRTFEYEAIGIPYTYRAMTRLTIPDFLLVMLDGAVKIVEVKAKRFMNSKKELAKQAACREFCLKRGWTYEVWTEDEIWPGLTESQVREDIKHLT